MPAEEFPLPGGNVSGAVRVGSTIRKPGGWWTPAVDAFLRHLNEAGYVGAPRTFGIDEQGRHVLEFVEGVVCEPWTPDDPTSAAQRVGGLLRDLHDAADEFVPPPDARWNVAIRPDAEDLVVHHDLSPWNLVVGSSSWVFIDWDNAGPGSRLWDLAYAAHGFVPLAPSTPVADAARAIAALVEGYRLEPVYRPTFISLLARRTRSMYELLLDGGRGGVEPWSRLWAEGHGATWLADTAYIERHGSAISQAILRAR